MDVLLTVTPSTTSSASDAACFWDVLGVPAIVGSARKSFNAESVVVILIALSAPIGDFTTNEYTPADICKTDALIPDNASRDEANPCRVLLLELTETVYVIGVDLLVKVFPDASHVPKFSVKVP